MNVYVEVKENGEWRWCHKSDGEVMPYSSGASTLPVLELAERILRFALMGADVGCTLHVKPYSVAGQVVVLCESNPDRYSNLVQLMDEKQVKGQYDVFIGRILDGLAPS